MKDYKTYKEKLLSDENIFLSIYLVKSYILNIELLTIKDQCFLNKLQDIYNISLIRKTIEKVRIRLNELISDDNDFLSITAYFKPKKFDKESKAVIFRPLHTSSVINQICMVAMLQILIYDYDENNNIIPSEISRLIPTNFYGNRICFDGQCLFKPWANQYKIYSGKANEIYRKSLKTHEYKYEINLDLKNFFPSINPYVFYNYIIKKIPLRISDEDKVLIKTVIKKLLFFKLSNKFDSKIERDWYYKDDNFDLNSNCLFAKGLPQGLPHTYFFANLFMLQIKEIYNEKFSGASFFYVDDSICFTNIELTDNIFYKIIDDINEEIVKFEKTYNKLTFLINDYNYKDQDFGVSVHTTEKSIYTEINNNSTSFGETYLRGICREASTFGFDMYSSFSDDEIIVMKNKIDKVQEHIKKEIILCSISGQIALKNKLLRYQKFFSYRLMLLKYMTFKIEKEQDLLHESYISDLIEKDFIIMLNNLIINKDYTNLFKKYNDDILFSTISFILKMYKNENTISKEMLDTLLLLNEFIYKDNSNYSYIIKAYEIYFKKINISINFTKYDSIYNIVQGKLNFLKKQNYNNKIIVFNSILAFCKKDCFSLFDYFNIEYIFKCSLLIRKKNDNLIRIILNCCFSNIFEYTVNDNLILEKKGKESISYFEVRTICYLRNYEFKINLFKKIFIQFSREDYLKIIDYTLLQVLPYYKIFVKNINKIDDLILVHKYCCDTWKNGSKYLHFYTLHNQEHAVNLIKNSIQILHSISYFKLKKIDYYILFSACYLHDISMVTLPDFNCFSFADDDVSNLIYTDFMNKFREYNKETIYSYRHKKKLLSDTYKKIDTYYEHKIRNNHAFNSAYEIREFDDLDFIETTTRELIAEVSEAHGQNTEDVYKSKSLATNSLVSLKYTKILLRLSDLLDISRYRISKVILKHNLKELDNTSRFHWISHLITDGYQLENEYITNPNLTFSPQKHSYIEESSIVEKIILTIEVLISQTTEIFKKNQNDKCKYINSIFYDNNYILNDDEKDCLIKMDCDSKISCQSKECNFLCKWFTIKNKYLIDELAALKTYLNSVDDNYYKTEIELRIKVKTNQNLPNDYFDYLKDYIEENN